ncbi:MAG: sigma-70 family RNA polymerase sigma factor [Planctomycetota bacterium]
MKPCTDLVQRAQSDRTPESLGALVSATQADVFHFLCRQLRHAADAEDATQETFRQVLRALPSLRDPAAFPGWIHRIALRSAQDVVRGRAARKRLAAELPGRANTEGAAMSEAERAETRLAVRGAVEELDEELRTTVVLRYEQGLSYGEIAEAMECPEGTVGKRLHRAHERLRVALAGAAIALTLVAVETELSAEPRVETPVRLKESLTRMSRGEIPVAHSKRALVQRLLVVVLAVAALFLVLWRFGFPVRRPAGDGGSADNRVASALPGNAGTAKSSLTESPSGGVENGNSPAATAVSACRVTGQVREAASGETIAGARVWLVTADAPARIIVETKTDALGNYGFEVPPGNWLIDVAAEGFVRLQTAIVFERQLALLEHEARAAHDHHERAVTRGRVTTTAGENTRVDLEVPKAVAARGIVSDEDGVPVEDAVVAFEMHGVELPDGGFWYSYGNDDRPKSVRTDSAGSFMLTGLLGMGEVELNVNRIGFQPTKVKVSLGPLGADASIALRRGIGISGIVVDTEGHPVSGACILLAEGDSSKVRLLVVQETRADAGGRFSIPDAPSGTSAIVAAASGFGWTAAAPDVGGASLTLVLPRATGILRGAIRDENGKLLPGVEVRVEGYFGQSAAGAGLINTVDEHGGSWTSPKPGEMSGVLPRELRMPFARTDEKGEFSLDAVCLSGGMMPHLSIEADGFRSKRIEATTSTFLEILLERESGEHSK